MNATPGTEQEVRNPRTENPNQRQRGVYGIDIFFGFIILILLIISGFSLRETNKDPTHINAAGTAFSFGVTAAVISQWWFRRANVPSERVYHLPAILQTVRFSLSRLCSRIQQLGYQVQLQPTS